MPRRDGIPIASLPERLRPGYVYLLSFSKETRDKGYTLKHYHVGIIHVDDAGKQWFYNTTTGAKKSYRRNVSSPSDRAAFLKRAPAEDKVQNRP